MGRKRGMQHAQQQSSAATDGDTAAEQQQQQEACNEAQPDPPAAAIAVCACPGGGALVAVASGPEVRVFDPRLGEVKTLRGRVEGAAPNQQYNRGLAFHPAGAFLAAGCDDKSAGMLLWDTSSWEQVQSLKVPKRVSAVAMTNDGAYMLAADKFGDVHVTATRPAGSAAPTAPGLLLGHFCSILTSVTPSRCGRFVATTDRDQKARVSVLPPAPLDGAHDIQSFCMGHTGSVTCSAFVAQGDQELLVTGGTDGTVRLWDHTDGTLLDTWDSQASAAAAAAEQPQEGEEGEGQQQEQAQEADAEPQEEGAANGEEAGAAAAGTAEPGKEKQQSTPVVLSVAASPDGAWVAALVEDRDEVALLRVDWGRRALAEAGWRRLEGLHLPTQLAFGAGNRLWAVGGPPTLESATAFVAATDIAADGSAGASFPAGALPVGVREALEARDGSEAAALAEANEAAAQRRAMRLKQLLHKRSYDAEEMQQRKRHRRDVRAKLAKEAAQQGRGQRAEQQQQQQEPAE